MNADSKRGRKAAQFAVMRDYRPARIERDLLARVFDLVDRGAAEHCGPSGDGETLASESIDITPSHDDHVSSQHNALEPTA